MPARHLDVRFLAVVPPGTVPAISGESLDLRWYRRDRLPRLTSDDVPEQVRRAFDRLS